ncbi:hypothetical protein [Pseudomonas syringae]|uniref:Uncharacterized protein n=1 Tax=Pseudomonas syringae TaxID=317 RepID=A0A085VDI0_PSESX|nr:hypothetical protein [Pseudomonas syringae]KFE53493.1 hypothetical protein IV01_19240 [Pseudomonas syringae]
MTVGQDAGARHTTPITHSRLTRLFFPLIKAAVACAPVILILFDNAAHHRIAMGIDVEFSGS